MQEISHSVQIEQKKTLTVVGVEAVKQFSETKIELILSGTKERFLATGTGLKISGFSKTSGTFTATGTIESVRYLTTLKSRIFR